MMVLDSSMTIGWFVPDEEASQELLDLVVRDGAVVPAIWPLEIGNALLMAVRRKRITSRQRAIALEQIARLPIERDTETLAHAWTSTLELADRLGLTLYDACYLELAQRRRLPLASLDRDLRSAAKALRVPLLGT